MGNKRIGELVDQKSGLFIEVSDKVWEYAETRFQEDKSAVALCQALASEGFKVEKGVGGMDTAFVASYGEGAPVIAILGEYDALSGMSQQAGKAVQEALISDGSGHGCGHNLLGAGALAAAVAVKDYMAENKMKGTVRYYGCPGEEGGSGKTYMVREGLFKDVDAALTWHPMSYNTVWSLTTLANYQVAFRFHGRSAHAAASPHLGRSALDAVELMNVGVNYLREHVIQEARMHYAVTNSGGTAPNVVQALAEVLYLIRAPKLDQVEDIYQRICDIARGAALMTGTTVEILFEKACSNLVPNETVERLMLNSFEEIGGPQLTAEEKALAHEFKLTLSEAAINSEISMAERFMGGPKIDMDALAKEDFSSEVLPYAFAPSMLPGSTDVGDVSWVVPTGQVVVACHAFGTPLHSWQAVAQGKTSFAHKGMLIAGKVIAEAAIELLSKPEVVEKAKEELKKNLRGAIYKNPIPAEIKPSIAK